ncbi:MAG TPA: type II toxin-antitoxin system death-on-curing family toxin [Polyangiaceae bacterium]|jgi:death-on-curing protein|nr:type II toxin-antitoxin system death-on-curing family toxin [Polyangiaceae bacterium]
MSDPRFLSLGEVTSLHADQLARYGGSAGVRDPGALESAIETPRATFDGVLLHEGIFSMAAAYAFHIAESQSLVDGNKRAALNAALVFLLLNGWVVVDPGERLYEAMIGLSARTMSKSVLAAVLEQLSVPDDEPDVP